jgi:hypothetical protein
MKVHGLTEFKLTDMDWELLDALFAVLAVSFTHIHIRSSFNSLHRFLIWFSK